MAKKQKSFAEKASSTGGKDLVNVKFVKIQEITQIPIIIIELSIKLFGVFWKLFFIII